MIISSENSQAHEPQSPFNSESEADFKSDELEEVTQMIDTRAPIEVGYPSILKFSMT